MSNFKSLKIERKKFDMAMSNFKSLKNKRKKIGHFNV